MSEKINLQELTALLSDKAGITKKDADAFLREFFGLMTESLIEDKIVKIRNLGTFKLTEVEARESVNISTGERFLIAAHSRVSFNPEKALSEIINKPYKHLEPELIEEELKIGDRPKEDFYDDFPEEVQQPEESIVIDNDELAEETIQRKKNQIKTAVFTFLIVGLLIPCFYYFSRDTENSIYTSTYHPNKIITNTPRKNNPENNLKERALNDSTEFINNQTDTIASTKDTAENGVWRPGRTRVTKPADRLTLIAYEEYGDVVFWIYIYEENKHLIGKDNYVKPGVTITIPPPEKYGINANDPKSLQRARDFAKDYENNPR